MDLKNSAQKTLKEKNAKRKKKEENAAIKIKAEINAQQARQARQARIDARNRIISKVEQTLIIEGEEANLIDEPDPYAVEDTDQQPNKKRYDTTNIIQLDTNNNNITRYAETFITNMSTIQSTINAVQLTTEQIDAIDAEINGYMSITNGQYMANPYLPGQNTFIKNSIMFYRKMKALCSDEALDQEIITQIKKIYTVINHYQAGTDNDDIILSPGGDRLSIYFQISRYFNLDPNQLFLSRPVDETGLGKVFYGFDEDEQRALGQNRFYNILFGTFFHLIFAALVFPHWPIEIPRDVAPISVYIGIGVGTDANRKNFMIDNIQPGHIIRLYAPITSASNDAKVADGFVKQDGGIIKINLASGKSFMCVSASPNEAETFVLAGEYQFIGSYNVVINGRDLIVYEFNQLPNDFTGLTQDEIVNNWTANKQKIISYSVPISNASGPIVSLQSGTQDFTVGGSKRRSNKIRRSNKTRRTKTRRSNKTRRSKTRRSKTRRTKTRRTKTRRTKTRRSKRRRI